MSDVSPDEAARREAALLSAVRERLSRPFVRDHFAKYGIEVQSTETDLIWPDTRLSVRIQTRRGPKALEWKIWEPDSDFRGMKGELEDPQVAATTVFAEVLEEGST